MQLQGINGINSNTNFGHLKGIQYKGEFCKNSTKSVCATDAILFSDAITKDLGSKYDFIAKLEGTRGRYKLILIPETRTNNSKKPSWVVRIINFFRSNKEEFSNKLTEEIKKFKKELPKLPNLPREIQVCYESDKSKDDSFKNFIKSLEKIDIDFLDSTFGSKVKK